MKQIALFLLSILFYLFCVKEIDTSNPCASIAPEEEQAECSMWRQL